MVRHLPVAGSIGGTTQAPPFFSMVSLPLPGFSLFAHVVGRMQASRQAVEESVTKERDKAQP